MTYSQVITEFGDLIDLPRNQFESAESPTSLKLSVELPAKAAKI